MNYDTEGIGQNMGMRGNQVNIRSIINMCTWKIGNLNRKEDELVDWMKLYNKNYLGITKIKKKSQGTQKLKDGY